MKSLVRSNTIRALVLAFSPVCVYAEVIQIPVGSQNPQAATLERPALGMLKDPVRSRFGEPQKRHAAVGNPPIERWDYEQFSVYFEYDHVIHSVLHGPKPSQ